MFNRPQKNKYVTKREPQGRHIPAALNQARKPLIKKITASNPPNDDFTRHPVDLMANNLDMIFAASAHSPRLNWKAIFILLLLLPLLVRAHSRNSRDYNSPNLGNYNNPNRRLLNGQVENLPENALCCEKTIGSSPMGGQICLIDDTVYYLKALRYTEVPEDGKHLCAGEFYRQLIKQMGINVPDATFFKEVNSDPKPDRPGPFIYYHATKEVPDIQFSNKDNPTRQDMLSTLDKAYLTVASLILRDLHKNNWGYTKDGLVIIDFDGRGFPLENFEGFQGLVAEQMRKTVPNLDVDDIINMRHIYAKMLNRLLPLYHDHFYLPHTLYRKMIKACMFACDEIIKKHRRDTQCFDDQKINIEFADIIEEYRVSQPTSR